ncbi:MAG TPA: HD domain-containing phosphohydrolase, partial [Urbifossiella sp.]|nr:HD domain-containing phosphohydrolase [Urbifossiella sp.]
ILADELRLSEADRRLIRVATPLHDIGKIAIDDGVLRKPDRLTEAEFGHMKGHVLSGVGILEMIPALGWAMPVIRSHHEKWDGSGYPDGLKGEAIPLVARVVAVADAFDAMTSDRPYRKGMPADAAFAELEAKAGSHFDPTCVTAYANARQRVEAVLHRETSVSLQAETASNTIDSRELERARRGG